MLRPLKSEVEAVSLLLQQGADSPDDLAVEVIQLVESLREHREVWLQVFELTPGVYAGTGPFATRAAAQKALPKNLWSQTARRGALVPMLGLAAQQAALAKTDEPPAERSDYALIREDAAAFKAGWRGKQADRARYLPTT